MNWKSVVVASVMAVLPVACGDNSQPATAPAPAPATKPAAAVPAAATAAVAAATSAATAAVADVKAAADKLLADMSQYIKDNKWDLADKGMAELDKMRPNLPAEYGPRIDQIKQLLATAKAAASKLPASLPKIP